MKHMLCGCPQEGNREEDRLSEERINTHPSCRTKTASATIRLSLHPFQNNRESKHKPEWSRGREQIHVF